MQIVTPNPCLGRVGFIVPMWTIAAKRERQGLPFRSIGVAGALLAAGYEVIWFDQERDADGDEGLRMALVDVDVVFLWMNELDPQLQTMNCLAIAGKLKSWYPSVTTVVGGEFVMICPSDGLDLQPPIDHFIRSYGEEACVEFMQARKDGSFDAVSGLMWKNGRLRANAVKPTRPVSPDSLAIYRQLDLSGYIQEFGGIFGNDRGTLVVTTSRGCPKRCRFCYWSGHGLSLHKADDIVDLIVFLRERYGVKQYHIGELDFAASRKRLLRFAELMRDRAPDCEWFALVSPIDMRQLSAEEWKLLYEGGCRKLEFGAESGSSRALELMGKKHEPDDVMLLAVKALEHEIIPMFNFVFGIVDETEVDRIETLQLISRMQRLPQSEWIIFTFRFFQPAWETEMGKQVLELDPSFPRSVADYLASRSDIGDEDVHTMRWLSATEERQIKSLIYYFLPMTTSKFMFEQRRHRLVYRLLRWVAKQRIRRGFFGLPIDRRVFGRLPGQALDNTYTV